MSKFKVGDKVYLECEVITKFMLNNAYALKYKNWCGDECISTDFVGDDVLRSADELYNKGFNDAWELAKKITLPTDNGGYSCEELENIFGYRNSEFVFKAFTSRVALAKVKDYEERNEIRVGDVVKLKSDYVVESIVTRITKTNIYRLFKDGSCSSSCDREDLRKTGRHFDSIDEFMRSEE